MITLVPLIQVMIKVILPKLDFGIKVQIRLIQILKKKVIIMLIKKI